MEIATNISIDDLVKHFPASVQWLRERNITCIICGEPVWGTLGELLESKGHSVEEIQQMVTEMITAM